MTSGSSPDLPQDAIAEYRIGRLQQRIAGGSAAQLGVHIESRAGTVVVRAVVPTATCRDELLAVIADELADLPVRTEVVLVAGTAPDCTETLS